jgi:hypothetical protein
MTKEEQNQIIKSAWVRALQKENDIPDNIGEIYKNWVLTKIQQASDQLTQTQGPQGEQDQQQQEAS